MMDESKDIGRDPIEFETRMSGDGSTTLYSSRFGQHYHNPNGALRESLHVFFRPLGLIPALARGTPFAIFETGFGTGLNLLLLLHRIQSLPSASRVTYWSVEAHPAPAAVLSLQNHAARLGMERAWHPVLERMERLDAGWNRLDLGQVTLHLFHGRVEEIANLPAGGAEPSLADFIFHDPFSPDVNPECWTAETFSRLRGWSKPGCTLRTYSASSMARAAMAHAGWWVARHPGALGKREMTLASPIVTALAPFPVIDPASLRRRYPMID